MRGGLTFTGAFSVAADLFVGWSSSFLIDFFFVVDFSLMVKSEDLFSREDSEGFAFVFSPEDDVVFFTEDFLADLTGVASCDIVSFFAVLRAAFCFAEACCDPDGSV